MAKVDPYKDQSVEELNAMYRDLSKEIYDLVNEFKITRKIEKPHLIKAKKRERARVLTFLRQKGGALTY